MIDKAPFSQEELNRIFKVSSSKPDRIVSRESATLEFKESFGGRSLPRYLRTCAAYANARGGYIVFGVSNSPRRLVGLSGDSLKFFGDIDPEQMSQNLNERFAPEVHWELQEHELNGKIFGLLYIYESADKPIVCTRNDGRDLKEGDIYYRYSGRSQRIRYPELRAILDSSREKEQKLWLKHLTKIARVGVRDAGVFDLKSGQVTGANGSFLIDESLLSQLSFIKEGEFSETRGKPTLKLIGDLEAIGNGPSLMGKKEIVRTKGIRLADIVEAFLKHDSVSDPLEYVRQICSENTGFLPVHYFIDSAGLDADETIEILKGVLSRSRSKPKLIGRLQERSTQQSSLPTGTAPTTQKKREFAEQLVDNSVDQTISGNDLKHCLQTIRCLPEEEIKTHSAYLRDLLRTWFNQHYASPDGSMAENLRRAICWVDEALYMETAK